MSRLTLEQIHALAGTGITDIYMKPQALHELGRMLLDLHVMNPVVEHVEQDGKLLGIKFHATPFTSIEEERADVDARTASLREEINSAHRAFKQ